jgi:hypothetical protein
MVACTSPTHLSIRQLKPTLLMVSVLDHIVACGTGTVMLEKLDITNRDLQIEGRVSLTTSSLRSRTIEQQLITEVQGSIYSHTVMH